MHEFPSQSICLNFSHLHYNLHDNFVTTYLKGISIDAYLKCKNHDHSSTFTNIKSDEQ